MRYLFIVHGWPVIATRATRHRYTRSGVLFDAYEDERALLRDFRMLLRAEARRRAAEIYPQPEHFRDAFQCRDPDVEPLAGPQALKHP
jgi:hypothetical protein